MLNLARPAHRKAAEQATREQRTPSSAGFPPAERLARLFPQLEIRETIGHGGMGAVYRAYQPNLDRMVALKVMSPKLAEDPSFAERFTREARTLARLNHHNIVNVYDFGNAGGVYYLLMELVEGVNLRSAMKAGNLSPDESLSIVRQICDALQFAHEEGVVHRDIKPENVLLDKKGRVKIADFGLAKLMQDDRQPWTLTGSQQVLGTLNYMAPEQIERPGEVDHRADIYSLGVVLYELLTGELPLGRFPLPSERKRGSAELDQVVMRTLAKEPRERYQHASEVKTAVDSVSAANMAVPPQLDSSRSPGPSGESRERLRVPFVITESQLGLWQTHGVLRFQGDKLQIEYVVRESVFHSWVFSSGQHELPMKELLDADLRQGLFNDTICLRLDRLRKLSGFPAAIPGLINMKVKRAYRSDARQLVNHLRHALQQTPLPKPNGDPGKPPTPRQEARRAVTWPALGMIIAGCLTLVASPLLAIAFWLTPVRMETIPQAPTSSSSVSVTDSAAQKNEGDSPNDGAVKVEVEVPQVADTDPPADVVVETSSGTSVTVKPSDLPINSVAIVVCMFVLAAWIGLGICSFLGGLSLLQLRSYRWCATASLLAAIPLHPGALLGIPSGIWAMVALSRPEVYEQFE